jgi:microcystin-dependent protein
VTGQKQYSEANGDFTVTGTGWTTQRAVLFPHKTQDGSWRLQGNISGTGSSASSYTLSISGVVFKNISGFEQPVSMNVGGAVYAKGYTNPNTGYLVMTSAVAATSWRVSIDVELEGKPTWADDVTDQYMAAVPTSSLVPTGTVSSFAGTTAPDGYLICDGSEYDESIYPQLFAVIGSTFNTGGETAGHFRVPQLEDEFIRGASTGNPVGQSEEDAMQGHYHFLSNSTFGASLGSPYSRIVRGAESGVSAATYVGSPTTDGVNGTPRTASETRPQNIRLNYIIKT